MRKRNAYRLDPPAAERLPRSGRVPPPSNPDPLGGRLGTTRGGNAAQVPDHRGNRAAPHRAEPSPPTIRHPGEPGATSDRPTAHGQPVIASRPAPQDRPTIANRSAPQDRPTIANRSAARVRPVFVDRTGRRRRVVVLAGLGLGAGLLVSLGLLALGLLTGGSASVPGWPDAGGGHLRDEAGTGRSGTDAPATTPPTGGAARTAPAAPGTARPANPTTRPAPPSGTPATTDRPGQGDLRRNPSPGNPAAGTDKPGKSRRSPAAG
ncbi:hypothetical protein ABNF97_10200 [Plantactinospora sp. B6F1]|uniref:hypothetical protein n=1 Tax=Plantactinospora sp. B6F1 TaxID=3158971 RepID=UPI0032D94773